MTALTPFRFRIALAAVFLGVAGFTYWLLPLAQ